MNIIEINKLEKKNAQLDLNKLDLSDTWLLQEVTILLEPDQGEEGKAETHEGILLIRKH